MEIDDQWIWMEIDDEWICSYVEIVSLKPSLEFSHLHLEWALETPSFPQNQLCTVTTIAPPLPPCTQSPKTPNPKPP